MSFSMSFVIDSTPLRRPHPFTFPPFKQSSKDAAFDAFKNCLCIQFTYREKVLTKFPFIFDSLFLWIFIALAPTAFEDLLC